MSFHRTRGPKNADWWSDTPSKPVRIRYGTSEVTAEPAKTVVDMFEEIVSNYSKHTALAVKRTGEWKTWTYRAYYEEACVVAKGFIEVSYSSVTVLSKELAYSAVFEGFHLLFDLVWLLHR